MSVDLRPKIGLALGSGGARGLSHIGVIKALKKNNVPIDYIAGTSIGAVIGGFYALSSDIDQVEKTFLATDWKRIIKLSSDIRLFSGGLLAGNRITEFIQSNLHGGHDFNHLKIPFVAIAADIMTGEQIIIDSGQLALAIRASASFPGILEPVAIGDRLLMDGGLVNPVPADVVHRAGMDIVIAVNLENNKKPPTTENKYESNSIYYNIRTALRVMQHNLSCHCLAPADIIIEPEVNNIYWQEGNVYWRQFRNAVSLIDAGARAAEKQLPSIRTLIKKMLS